MPDSAKIDDGGLREQKRLRTRSSIVATARALTLEHGLGGFTVEQLCDRVGISRRTFFNYFPAKEDAILGHPDAGLPEDLVEQFLAGSAGNARPPLLEALTTLFAELGARLALSREEYLVISEVIRKEPQLLARIFARTEARQQDLIDLITRREDFEPDDRRAKVATFLIGGLARRSVDEFFEPHNTLSYSDVLRRNVEAVAILFTPLTKDLQ
ncbi:TetR family transcriptional regulator [Arthrobacter crusticola]|uniref:TetR family transcriptional regulator n=1 Tax=Arthrobacter crusticola TaxID=2547960 RepID=A0A4R5TZR1_9MICC|nr:TetR/AcrR family transcriptional regulator [Arthrobacter crusticola]TDK26787.1 TetR family transcriptional regulator [Arthrobacter crusticola]